MVGISVRQPLRRLFLLIAEKRRQLVKGISSYGCWRYGGVRTTKIGLEASIYPLYKCYMYMYIYIYKLPPYLQNQYLKLVSACVDSNGASTQKWPTFGFSQWMPPPLPCKLARPANVDAAPRYCDSSAGNPHERDVSTKFCRKGLFVIDLILLLLSCDHSSSFGQLSSDRFFASFKHPGARSDIFDVPKNLIGAYEMILTFELKARTDFVRLSSKRESMQCI